MKLQSSNIVSFINTLQTLAARLPSGQKAIRKGRHPIASRDDLERRYREEVEELLEKIKQTPDDIGGILSEIADVAYYIALLAYTQTGQATRMMNELQALIKKSNIKLSLNDAFVLAIIKYTSRIEHGKNEPLENHRLLSYYNRQVKK